MYALFDWDYTLHEGYSVYQFGEYLMAAGVISTAVMDELTDISDRHDAGILNSEELNRGANGGFARAFAGMTVAEMTEHIRRFCEQGGSQPFYPFVQPLFDYLHRKGITPIPVSGTLTNLARYFADAFHLGDAYYTFELEERDGVYTGGVVRYGGCEKIKAVDELVRTRGEPPVLGMGDSASDAPLLDRATVKLSIGKQNDWARYPANHRHFADIGDVDGILAFVKKHLGD